MPLHPGAAAMLERQRAQGWVPRHTLTPEAAREQLRRLRVAAAVEPVASVEERAVPGPAGGIPIRIYRPVAEGDLPALLFFHGGGWVLGDLDMSDGTCRQLANAVGCVVVSVDYRLAPEHRFPAAFDDCYTAAVWVRASASSLGIRPDAIAVSGVSAGGNLAAAVALAARDRGGPEIGFQLLVCPVLDFNFDRPSYLANATGYSLERDDMRWFWKQYVGDMARASSPYAAPLRAPSLAGLPPAHIITAEYDPLRDEGAAYATRLDATGVPVTYRCCEGMLHGVLGSPLPPGRAAFDEACERLRDPLYVPA